MCSGQNVFDLLVAIYDIVWGVEAATAWYLLVSLELAWLQLTNIKIHVTTLVPFTMSLSTFSLHKYSTALWDQLQRVWLCVGGSLMCVHKPTPGWAVVLPNCWCCPLLHNPLSVHRHPHIHIYSQLMDAHLYLMKRWVLDYLCENKWL